MTRHDPRFAELLPAYALGALDPEEHAEVARHLAAGCPECERELSASLRAMEALADVVPSVAPPPITRRRILAAVRREAGSSGGREEVQAVRKAWAAPLTAAAVLLLAVGGGRIVVLERRLEGVAADHEAQVRELRQTLTEERQRGARQNAMIAILASRNVVRVPLAGQSQAPAAFAQATVETEMGRAVFVAHNLPPQGPARTYQLWTIPAGGSPVSAGVFATDEKGSATVLVESLQAAEAIAAWAVSIEPAGGVLQPTGAIVLLGEVPAEGGRAS